MDSSRSDWFTRLLYTGAAVGGATFVAIAARHFLRVSRARAQLQSLLLGVAGSDARVVITGASGGIGRELAQQLLRNPSVHVLVGCRYQKKAKSIFRSERAKVHSLDLLDPDSVQAFVEEAHSFLAGDTGLRMLVNNAGVRPPPSSSAKGFDCTWQTNFLGPFLLTELLARLRQKHQHSPVRVVHVSSRLEKRSELNAELLESIGKGEVPETSAYSDSKRALMLWTSVRAQSLAFKGGLFCHCTTPGMVDSDLGRHTLSPWRWPLTKPLRLLLLRSSAEGALSVAHHALTPAATSCFGRYADGKTQLEDLVIERMGDKQLALSLVKWATKVTALEQRADGYDR